MPIVVLFLSLFGAGLTDSDVRPELLLGGELATEVAPHGEGNVYAPDVHVDGNRYRMWYGGQGRDGHDRIHLAESEDGTKWVRRGVVLEDGTANHVNDPSVVRVGGHVLHVLHPSRTGHHRRDRSGNLD